MPLHFTDSQYAVVAAACARLIPTDADPGATEAGVVDYIDQLLAAFSFDPPRIWAGGPFSGRAGGAASFGDFLPLGRIEQIAWRARIEAWQAAYALGVAALGDDFVALDGDGQDERLRAGEDFTALLYEHACEGMYGAPEYGGNRDLVGWGYIGFAGDVQPRGWTAAETSEP